MTSFDERRSAERPVFFRGQALEADDLQSLDELHRTMRWLHNRSLHQPGVGSGFAVAGRRGDREVRVDSGYALDGDGREIVLLEAVTEPVPPVAADTAGGPVAYDLTVAYPADEDLEEAETRDGVCLPRGAVRLRERPVLCWVRLARDVTDELRPVDPQQALDLQQARKIALARALVRGCKLDADLAVAARRDARPEPCPRIACGHARPVAWEIWETEEPDGDGGTVTVPIGVQATVDTSAAGFRLVPNFQARAAGVRPLQVATPDGFDAVMLDVPAFVTEAAPDGFRCTVPVISLRSELDESLAGPLVEAAREAWSITWMGVEP